MKADISTWRKPDILILRRHRHERLCLSRVSHLRCKSASASPVPRSARDAENFRLLGSRMLEDLSHYHQPISTLFPHSTPTAHSERYRLSEEQLEFFRENGYLKGVRILTDEPGRALLAVMARCM